MVSKIRVAILDDHPSIIDGFRYRLSMDPDIQIVCTAFFGEDLESMVANSPMDVLLLDVSVPNSAEDHNPYPVLHVIPSLLKEYPGLNILVISMFTQRTLIEALVNVGVSGYIFKDDQSSIQQLDKIVRAIANGGIYFSEGATWEPQSESLEALLTPRQLEALSLCASHPDDDTFVLAHKLGVTGSTLRNLLSGTYFRLGVRTRAAAIAKAHQLGFIPVEPEPDLAFGKAATKSSGARRAKRRTEKVG
jgi:DNA-binding NarL/FixJ family response regulator